MTYKNSNHIIQSSLNSTTIWDKFGNKKEIIWV